MLLCRLSRSSPCRSYCPVVQVMGDAVAVAAFRELGHDAGCVRYTVAVLTLRHHLVFFLVTGYAEEGLMFCLAGNNHVVSFCVTGSALFGWSICSINNSFRHVSLVALLAVAGTLIGRVSLVALSALWDLAVNIVAERAGELGVLARVCLQLGNLRGVTGEARISNVTAENNLFWLVRILVALEAAAELVVRFAFVALTAERDDFSVSRRMTLVAVLTGNHCLVGSAFCFDVSRSFCVTLDAVAAGQGNCRLGCCCRCCLRRGRFCCRFGGYCY